jgi:hypothetical protein
VAGSCENGNEPSDSIKCWESLEAERLAASQKGLNTMELVIVRNYQLPVVNVINSVSLCIF